MTIDLQPRTEAGARLIEAAEALQGDLRRNAAAADRSSVLNPDNFSMLQQTGIAGAFVPEALGGWGLTSVHDWMLGVRALGQGDGSTAIAISMHFGVSRGMAQAFAQAGANTDSPAAAPLRAIADGKMLICATATERGTDNLHPFTEATRDGDEWVINGAKMFVTMSPVATHLAMNLRMRDESGDHLATTMMPIDTPGLVPQDDWDALGMRGSGSQSVVFDNVRLHKRAVRTIGPWGQWSTQVLINRTLGNLALVGAFLGIAEHARELALTALESQKRVGELMNTNPGVQQAVGELEIELLRCRAVLAHTGLGVDNWLADAARHPPILGDAHELMQTYQAAKWTVNRGAIAIVDQALDLAGGAGFMSGHPLSRLYRDVRAGPFMQPHAAVDIRRYVGQVALGLYPDA